MHDALQIFLANFLIFHIFEYLFISKINGFDPYLYFYWLVASREVSETLLKRGGKMD